MVTTDGVVVADIDIVPTDALIGRSDIIVRIAIAVTARIDPDTFGHIATDIIVRIGTATIVRIAIIVRPEPWLYIGSRFTIAITTTMATTRIITGPDLTMVRITGRATMGVPVLPSGSAAVTGIPTGDLDTAGAGGTAGTVGNAERSSGQVVAAFQSWLW